MNDMTLTKLAASLYLTSCFNYRNKPVPILRQYNYLQAEAKRNSHIQMKDLNEFRIAFETMYENISAKRMLQLIDQAKVTIQDAHIAGRSQKGESYQEEILNTIHQYG